MENINKILKEQINLVKPENEVVDDIKKISKEFCNNLRNKLRKYKIKADIFIGGSLAKGTLVKTSDNLYDVDVFVRFDKKYSENKIQELLKKVLIKGINRVHGSRDYYQFKVNNIIIEIIPVLKIKNPKEARNVTDLSYFHVNYILKKIKKYKKLSDEIIIAKAFTHSQNCYGAESYIKGFSGYAIELLIIYYGSFLKFIKEIASSNKKIIIDESKSYKKKKDVLMELNEAKILSPIILVDPTFKERNALSGLSDEAFEKFKKACQDFLKNPSKDFFKNKNILDEMKRYKDLRIVSVRTNKQKGDIAGTKSKKFMNFFNFELKKEFLLKKAEFEYKEDENNAYFYLVIEKKPEEIIKGPPITAVENLAGFKRAHADAFIKNQIAYARAYHNLSFVEFLKRFLEKNDKVIKDMSIEEIKLIK